MPALREVCVLGTGMGRFAKQPTVSFESLAHTPIIAAMADAGVSRDDVQIAYCGSFYGGSSPGQRILKGLGMTGIPIINTENACSSGSTAAREAWLGIASG